MYIPDPILSNMPMSAVHAAHRSIAIVFTSMVEHYNLRIIRPLEKSQTTTFNVQSI